MNIDIIGAGVVGQATGKGFARLGHQVRFYDTDPARCAQLIAEGYSIVRWEYHFPVDVVFFCVPEKAIKEAIEFCILQYPRSVLFVIRSTVPPGTTKRLAHDCDRHICFNPEFLREAVAEYEFLNPPGVILGECCKEHGDLLEKLYKPFRVPIQRVDTVTAELTKIVVNSYLACQISFWNQIKRVGDAIGVNSHEIGMLASYCDNRVSCYGARMHGKAYGGKCLPKDLEQLLKLCKEKNVSTPLLEAVKQINQEMK